MVLTTLFVKNLWASQNQLALQVPLWSQASCKCLSWALLEKDWKKQCPKKCVPPVENSFPTRSKIENRRTVCPQQWPGGKNALNAPCACPTFQKLDGFWWSPRVFRSLSMKKWTKKDSPFPENPGKSEDYHHKPANNGALHEEPNWAVTLWFSKTVTGKTLTCSNSC